MRVSSRTERTRSSCSACWGGCDAHIRPPLPLQRRTTSGKILSALWFAQLRERPRTSRMDSTQKPVRALVVDDHADALSMAQKLLGLLNCQAQICDAGQK